MWANGANTTPDETPRPVPSSIGIFTKNGLSPATNELNRQQLNSAHAHESIGLLPTQSQNGIDIASIVQPHIPHELRASIAVANTNLSIWPRTRKLLCGQ